MNTNIRKRRAYGHEDVPAESMFHSSPYTLHAGPNTLSLPADHRYILDQTPLPYVPPPSSYPGLVVENRLILEPAAFFLNPVASTPLELDSQQDLDQIGQHHSYKKPRLNTSAIVPMPAPYSDDFFPSGGQEKTPLGGQPDAGINARRKPYAPFPESGPSSGWTGSRLADCFASFSMCPPFETQPSYQSLLTPSSYDYDDHRSPSLDNAVVMVQPAPEASLLPTPITPGPTALFPCDDPVLMAEYLPNYPPLRPERTMGLQPAIGREEMVYPPIPPAVKYETDASNSRGTATLGTQSRPYSVDAPPHYAAALPGAYVPGEASCAYDRHGFVMNLPSRFHAMQGFDASHGTGSLAVQDELAVQNSAPVPRTIPIKRGPFKDQDSREKTALTRKMGSCIRCRMQRIRCNLDPENEKGPCLSCKKIAIGAKVYRLSCLRLKITDVKLFKPGQVKGQEWTNRWKDSVMDDIGNWESSQVRTIRVTEGYTGKSVRLQVRQFKPQEGDKVKRSWVSKNGTKHEVNIPAFAIVNLDDAKAEFDQYIKIGLVDCCHHLLGSRDKLLWQTYSLAIKAAQDPATPPAEKSLLISTLDLWMSVRLTTKSFEIVGDETLDMSSDIIDDEDNPLHGKIPLPPVMGAQIDSVIIHQIQPRLRRKALEELQKMTQEKKQKTWLTTYLVTFILLHNIALITKHDADYAKKHGMSTRFAREANVKEYNLGANTLLAYFHYCNKAIYPFSAECKDQDLRTLAELDDKAISFVHFTRGLAAEHKEEWEALWHQEAYEHECYYVSQLFEPNWQPRTMV